MRAKPKPKPTKHGGARPGAGRPKGVRNGEGKTSTAPPRTPSERMVTFSVCAPAAELARIDAHAAYRGITRSRFMVTSTLAQVPAWFR